MSEIKSRMAKLGMTQVDMILELQQRGIAIQPPMMCEKILTEKENESV